jgi:hypothetical protein
MGLIDWQAMAGDRKGVGLYWKAGYIRDCSAVGGRQQKQEEQVEGETEE